VNCKQASLLLPFLLNRSLQPEEEREIRAHLDRCAACAAELEEVRRTLWIASRHPPAEALADYACGLPLEGWPRSELERHFADCASCSSDLGLPGNESLKRLQDFQFQPVQRPQRTRILLPLAAATLVSFFAGSAVERTLRSPRAGEVQLAELLPASMVDRTGSALGEEQSSLQVNRPATLLLILDLGQRYEALRLDVRSVDGASVAVLAGLEARDEATVALHVPAGAWPEGDLRLRLEGLQDGAWRLAGEYAVRVVSDRPVD
jgi:hypothetical protein